MKQLMLRRFDHTCFKKALFYHLVTLAII